MIRPSVIEDVEYLSDKLRREDVVECTALGHTPSDALMHGLKHSIPCYTMVTQTGTPCGIGGVVPAGNRFGLAWLTGTPHMVDHTKTLIHDAKQLLVQLYDDYDCLGNWTHVDNVVHHRWLKWLGFKFINKVELTPGNHFYEFARLKGTT